MNSVSAVPIISGLHVLTTALHVSCAIDKVMWVSFTDLFSSPKHIQNYFSYIREA